MKKSIVFLAMLVAISSCQIKLDDYVNGKGQSFLSIEGGISDKLAQQTIKLFNTSEKIDNSSIMSPVTGAVVYVTDEKGTKIAYPEVGNGLYRTAEQVAGRVGGVYTLHMDIGGKLYESSPETLPFCPAIDKIYDEPTIQENQPTTSYSRAGFDVYLSFKDAPEKGNYYRWVWTHYDRVDVCTTCKGGAWNDKTNSCNDQNAPRFAPQYNQHCRNTCFDVVYSSEFNLMADDYINGQQVAKVFIARAPYLINEAYISGPKYFYEIEQRTLNKHTYDLFKLLKDTQNGGSFFDVPATTKFNLNVTCTNDPSQKIIGVFEVFGAKVQSYTVDLNQKIPGETVKIAFPASAIECSPFPCTSPCIESVFRTKTIPDGWKD